MKPPIEFRPKSKMTEPEAVELQKLFNEHRAASMLAHKRSVKAAQMRRYRAKRSKKMP